MTILFRWTFRLTVLLILLSVAALGLTFYLATQSLPNYEKEIKLFGLDAELEIIRDTYNVPHIFGQNDKDVLFGLGYVHAQDRLWQMATLRRKAQGRLAEVFGVTKLESDKFYRQIDLYGVAQESFNHFSDHAKELVQAYARGVNARISEVNRDSLGRGAPEMFLFNAPFAVWTPTDSLAILKLLGLQWSEHISREVLHAQLLLTLDDVKKIDDLMPEVPGLGNMAPIKQVNLDQNQKEMYKFEKVLKDMEFGILPKVGLAGASNAFAAANSRTVSGSTLLANDPHISLTVPSLWYLARLELQTGAVIGASVPGLPLILAGRSEDLGWAITSSYIDDQDILVEEIDPKRPDYFKTTKGYRKFESRSSIIQIRNQEPVTILIKKSGNGPIIYPEKINMQQIIPKQHVMALASTALQANDKSVEAFLNLMKSKSVKVAENAMTNFQSPSLNLTLADKKDISISTIGLRPERQKGHQSQGRWPSYGWRKANQWSGFLSFEERPQLTNRRNEILLNTNNKLTGDTFPKHGSFYWGDSQRIQRLSTLLSQRSVHTRDSFKEAQIDVVSYAARTLLPLVARDLLFTEQTGEAGSLAQRRTTAMALLADWNGEMNEYRPEPLIYAAWMRALQHRLIRDEIGQLAYNFIHLEPLFIERVFRDIEGASAWCDIIQSAKKEKCTEIASMALDDALIWLGEKYGKSIKALRWGKAHQALHVHPTLGYLPFFKHFVNISQSTGGGDHTIQRGRSVGTDPNPFQNIHAAGYRGVYDFSDPDSSIFVISTGQSGHPLSKHYDDLGQLWRRGEYWQMALSKELISSASLGTTRLLPAITQID